MKQQILNLYAMTLGSAEKLMAEVPCERCAELPYADAKHPGWVLSHLALGSGMMVGFLRGENGSYGSVPAAWAEVGMPGAPILGERGKYATKDELLGAMRSVHEELAALFTEATDEQLARAFPIEEYREFFPTMLDASVYLMAHHEGYHLGQMSQWRRAAGFAATPDP
jgi:hypothetical protein